MILFCPSPSYRFTHVCMACFRRAGSLFCPVYDSREGPFAAPLTLVADKLTFEGELQTYPFCPYLEEDEDLMVVSEYSTAWARCQHVSVKEHTKLRT